MLGFSDHVLQLLKIVVTNSEGVEMDQCVPKAWLCKGVTLPPPILRICNLCVLRVFELRVFDL